MEKLSKENVWEKECEEEREKERDFYFEKRKEVYYRENRGKEEKGVKSRGK